MDKLKNINYWIFDLDNTLYGAQYDLFPQIGTKMGQYIEKYLNMDMRTAKQLQKKYYLAHGTTLRGLMLHHQVDPHHFLDFVHDIDYAVVPENHNLKTALAQLAGQKIIHTNATKAHSEKVLAKIGLEDSFDAIFDIIDADFIPKPDAHPYEKLWNQLQIKPEEAAMVEDLPKNLAVPAQFGMQTILIYNANFLPMHHDGDVDLQNEAFDAHIHHRFATVDELLEAVLSA